MHAMSANVPVRAAGVAAQRRVIPQTLPRGPRGTGVMSKRSFGDAGGRLRLRQPADVERGDASVEALIRAARHVG